jgi:putative (di)nucleoside polyphosphate hydrolase
MSRKKTPPSELPYRKGVGAVLFNADWQVFVARRIDTPGDAWQMPQGGIDKGEDPRRAVLRELKEEIGTDEAKIIAETEGWLTYDLPAELVGRVWGGKYRGQKQKWFALRFAGCDSDIDLDAHHAEFSDWKWAEFERLPEMIVPFKRAIYEQVVAEFRHLLPRRRR